MYNFEDIPLGVGLALKLAYMGFGWRLRGCMILLLHLLGLGAHVCIEHLT